MKKMIENMVDDLSKRIRKIPKSNIPDQVFIESLENGYSITEKYFAKTTSGKFMKGRIKEKNYESVNLNAILAKYKPPTIIYYGDVS